MTDGVLDVFIEQEFFVAYYYVEHVANNRDC